MSIRQSKLIRLARQHSFEAHAIDGSDRVVEVTAPGASDHHRVSTVEELLAVLGY